MTAPPSKRRKMRPNNAISKEKQSYLTKVNDSVKEKQSDTTTKETKPKSPVKETKVEPTVKEKPSEIKSAEKIHQNTEKQEKKAKQKAEKKAKQKAEKKAKQKAEKKKTKHVMKRNTFKAINVVQPSSFKPAPKIYESASDSDETDKEEVAAPTIDLKALSKAEPTVMSERKNDKEKVESAKVASDTEMSDADTEEDALVKDTDASNKTKVVNRNVKYRTSNIISDSESESESEESSQAKDKDRSNVKKPYKSMEFSLQKTGNADYLKANRITFRKKKDYDENMTAAENIKGRLNDLFVPAVKDDDFISDSNSDTDSGEDYETREYPPWQRTLGLKHDKTKDPWPTQRKFGYSDKLKLERRIRKICKREGLSFVEAREIFSSSHRRPYLRFFQKIAKVFPNLSLHALAKQCKMMYHVKRVSSPWKPEEIAKLKELIEEHGTSPTLLSQYMDRSPKNISDFMYNHMSTGKINLKRWSPEEDQVIANAVAKMEPGKSFSATGIVPLLDGTRTPKQIHRRYYSIRHLIKKDGTIEPNRKATLEEELDYLKGLLKQVEDLGLEEESQLDYSKNKGFVAARFYLKSRNTIDGFEKMHIKEILEKLIERQERIIESRRLEETLRQK